MEGVEPVIEHSLYFKSKLVGGGDGRTVVIPVWLNTPLDKLARALFDFFAPLGLRVAALDGRISKSERQFIESYFVSEWGYYPEFVRKALPDRERNLENLCDIELVNNMIDYKIGNPDCDYNAMTKELIDFLKEVTRANGELQDLEVIYIQWLEITLVRRKPGIFRRRPKKKTEAEGEPEPNPASHGDVPNGDCGQGGDDGNGSSQEGQVSESTLVVRNFRGALRWAKDQLEGSSGSAES